jgi:VWFA-related protein
MRLLRAFLAVAALSLLAQQVTFRSDSQLVEVYATIFSERGKYVDGLVRDRFVVTENGQAQPIVAFESDSEGVSCAILLDTTGSMQEELPRVKNAVVKFIDGLRDIDSSAIYTFTTSVDMLQDFTQDRSEAKRAVLRTRAGGATALFDAIAQVSRKIENHSGKKALVVFTDGDDNSSVLHARAAIDRAKKSGVPVYMVAEGEALTKKNLLKEMEEISESTGAAMYEAKKPADVARIFEDIVGDLQHTYLLAYKPPEGDRVKWRPIQVSVSGLKNCKIRAKEGYFPN